MADFAADAMAGSALPAGIRSGMHIRACTRPGAETGQFANNLIAGVNFRVRPRPGTEYEMLTFSMAARRASDSLT